MANTEKSNGNKSEKSEAVGENGFYHIEIKSPEEFKRFRTQGVGEKSGIERVGGQRNDGTWETVKWIIGKKMAHIENGKLIADHNETQKLFDDLDAAPKLIEDDRFEAKA